MFQGFRDGVFLLVKWVVTAWEQGGDDVACALKSIYWIQHNVQYLGIYLYYFYIYIKSKYH